jgi:hypothetical protein
VYDNDTTTLLFPLSRLSRRKYREPPPPPRTDVIEIILGQFGPGLFLPNRRLREIFCRITPLALINSTRFPYFSLMRREWLLDLIYTRLTIIRTIFEPFATSYFRTNKISPLGLCHFYLTIYGAPTFHVLLQLLYHSCFFSLRDGLAAAPRKRGPSSADYNLLLFHSSFSLRDGLAPALPGKKGFAPRPPLNIMK